MVESSVRPLPPKGGARFALFAFIAVLVGAAVVFLLLWMGKDDDTAGPESGVTVEDVSGDRFADALIGRQVTVSAEVASTLVPGRAIWIGGEGLAGPPNVLVIASSLPPSLSDDSVVRVVGTVRDLDRRALGERLGLAGDFFSRYEDQNVIEAETITIIGRDR